MLFKNIRNGTAQHISQGTSTDTGDHTNNDQDKSMCIFQMTLRHIDTNDRKNTKPYRIGNIEHICRDRALALIQMLLSCRPDKDNAGNNRRHTDIQWILQSDWWQNAKQNIPGHAPAYSRYNAKDTDAKNIHPLLDRGHCPGHGKCHIPDQVHDLNQKIYIHIVILPVLLS